MNASVVVITCDNPKAISARLKELDSKAKVVIVDDSRKPVSYPPNIITDLHDGKRGAVKCLNIGIELCPTDIVILLGDDVSIPHDFVERTARYFDSGASIVGFNVIDRYNYIRVPRPLAVLAWLLCGQIYPERGLSNKFGNLYTVAFAFDKSKVPKRFDEGFKGSGFNAEFDFLMGEKMLYAADLVAYHSVPDEPYHKVVKRNKRLMLANRRLFLEKHMRLPSLRFLCYVGYLNLMPLAEFFFRGRQR